MNPLAFVVLAIGVLIAAIGVAGKQDDLIAAVSGKPYGHSSLK